MPDPLIAITAYPYEAAIIAIAHLFEKIIESQPPEVRAELWKMYVEDLKAWRAFWQSVAKL